MKFFYLLAFVFLGSAISFSSCSNGESDVRDAAREALPETSANTAPAATTPATPPATTTGAVTNASGVPHYECPNKCAGGVGAGAGNCPSCGTALAHNQAFHDTPASSPATPATPSTPFQTTTTTTTPPTGTAQNAAGVYHYICGNGCAGGAAGAGNCATCGGALAHNQDFHNN
ncbi:MAG: hypothetical protein NXI23_22520 [Bacteroidetes bacterium]|nr:hypothetical protein [Bacteroidota bacterium]MDF1863337.1 hypothetical protein [Saprospiraceae bacterium]